MGVVRVVRPRRHQGDVVGQRDDTQPRPRRIPFVAQRALAQVIHHVRRGRRAATVPDHKDLPPLVLRQFDGLNDLLNRSERDAI